MERPLVGEVVVVDFPYAGFKGAKRRPVFVLAYSGASDLILCQITSKNYHSESTAIELTATDFQHGGLPIQKCYVRVDKLFTFEAANIKKTVGQTHANFMASVKSKLAAVFDLQLL